jgi:hypothetical protein
MDEATALSFKDLLDKTATRTLLTKSDLQHHSKSYLKVVISRHCKEVCDLRGIIQSVIMIVRFHGDVFTVLYYCCF